MSQKLEKRIYWTKTQDGWDIALHRYQGNQHQCPVLLVHGLAANYTNMDFPMKDMSLAKFLCGEGFDCWIIDLRGSGLSKRKFTLFPKQWLFDDYVFHDLPAAIHKIRQVTRVKKIHWVGHSLGGILAYPVAQTFQEEEVLQSLITVATPLTTDAKPGYFKYLYRLDGLIRLIPALPYRPLSKIAALFPKLALSFESKILFAKENMTEEILKNVLNHTVENVPSSLILQIHDWFRDNHFSSHDRSIDFIEKLEEFSAPILMIIGSIDSFTPLKDIKSGFGRFPNADKKLMVFGKENGQENDYGHIDLLLGKNAPREVFPHIAKWIKKHDG